MHGNREISYLAASEVMSGPHREGEESKPMKHGQEKSDLFIIAEADEQTWATGDGVGGAKGEDRGKHGRATHVPDTAPD